MVSRILGDAFEWQPEVTNNHWSMLDNMGVECETSEFLYGLVRAVKPRMIVETGSYPGVGTEGLWRGMTDNDSEGVLHTFETDYVYYQNMQEKIGSRQQIVVHHGQPATYKGVQITFLDSDLRYRHEQFDRWVETAEEGSFLCYHDARDLPLRNWNNKVLIPVPRGLWLVWR